MSLRDYRPVTEPRLVTVIKRLADLEALPHLLPSELHELNLLRIELSEKWPAVDGALARAYVEYRTQP